MSNKFSSWVHFFREFYKLHGKPSYNPYSKYNSEEMYGKHVICESYCIPRTK